MQTIHNSAENLFVISLGVLFPPFEKYCIWAFPLAVTMICSLSYYIEFTWYHHRSAGFQCIRTHPPSLWFTFPSNLLVAKFWALWHQRANLSQVYLQSTINSLWQKEWLPREWLTWWIQAVMHCLSCSSAITSPAVSKPFCLPPFHSAAHFFQLKLLLDYFFN